MDFPIMIPFPTGLREEVINTKREQLEQLQQINQPQLKYKDDIDETEVTDDTFTDEDNNEIQLPKFKIKICDKNQQNQSSKINFNLEEREKQFILLQEVLAAKRKMIFENQRELCRTKKTNKYLNDVKTEYEEYNYYIYKQKQDQMKALEMLKEYIEKLTISGELSKQNIEDSKYEQKKIMREIRSIKKTLNSIIHDTETINTNL